MNNYSEDYFDALHLYHSGLFEECIEAAKYNITDPVMPRYHQMKNLTLIVTALADMQKQMEELREAMAASLRREKDQNEEQVSFPRGANKGTPCSQCPD
jgi:hypothetical protein